MKYMRITQPLTAPQSSIIFMHIHYMPVPKKPSFWSILIDNLALIVAVLLVLLCWRLAPVLIPMVMGVVDGI